MDEETPDATILEFPDLSEPETGNRKCDGCGSNWFILVPYGNSPPMFTVNSETTRIGGAYGGRIICGWCNEPLSGPWDRTPEVTE